MNVQVPRYILDIAYRYLTSSTFDGTTVNLSKYRYQRFLLRYWEGK